MADLTEFETSILLVVLDGGKKGASLGATASPNDSRVSCYTNQSCFPAPFYSDFAAKVCHGLGYDLAVCRKLVEGQGSLPQCRHWGLAVSLRMRCHSSTSTQRQQLAPWKRLCELPPHSLDTHPLETYHIPSFLLCQPRVPDFTQTPNLPALPFLSLSYYPNPPTRYHDTLPTVCECEAPSHLKFWSFFSCTCIKCPYGLPQFKRGQTGKTSCGT